MKILLFFAFGMIIFSGCKPDRQATEPKALTTVEKIAQVAGIEQWDSIKKVKFTFNVEKAGRSLYSRNWTWDKETGDVRLIAPPDTVAYNRNQPMDSFQRSADRAFVNDTYWLIPEFKFATDEGTQIIEEKAVTAPITMDTLNMFTIIYSDKGGYTPGDAYDIYYDKNYQLREWGYRRANDTIVHMATSFEKFETDNGITIARDHLTSDRITRISLKNIELIK